MKVRKPKRRQVEWSGQIYTLPFVFAEPNITNPELIVWRNQNGQLIGQEMHQPGDALLAVCSDLQHMIKASQSRPTRVRVGSRRMAEILSAGFPHLEIVHGPTPELDKVVELLLDHYRQDRGRNLLSPDITPPVLRWLFTAAAEFYRKKPWKVLDRRESVMLASIPALGLQDLAIEVVGQVGEFGLLVFASLQEHSDYCENQFVPGHSEPNPSHLLLNYDHESNLPANMLDDIATHRFEVAALNAYPLGVRVAPDGEFLLATAKESLTMAACAYAVAQIGPHHKAIQRAFIANDRFSHTFMVPAPDGDIEVTLTYADALPRR